MEKYTPQEGWEILVKLFKFEWVKFGLGGALALIMKVIYQAPTPWKTMLLASLILIGTDFLAGIVASVRVHKVRVSSALAGRTILKVFCYAIVLIVGSLVDVGLNSAYVTTLLLLCIVVAREGLSTLENVRLIWENMGYKWPFEFLADKLRKTTGNNLPPTNSNCNEFRNGSDTLRR